MEVVIGAIVSALGAHFCGMDFCTLYTFVSMSIALYKAWNNHTSDKTALQ